MQENIFQTLQGQAVQGQDIQSIEARRSFDKDIREAMRVLMGRKEGRVFIRWLGAGQSAHSILQLIMAYEEEKHG